MTTTQKTETTKKATETKVPATYIMRLPSSTKERPETYIVPKGPLGIERWLAKKNYTIKKDKDGAYAVLTQVQADYFMRTGVSSLTEVKGS